MIMPQDLAIIAPQGTPKSNLSLPKPSFIWAAGLLAAALCFATPSARADHAKIDEDQLELTLKKNRCLKCHSVDKKKEGPAYKDVAKKYKGKPDAEKKLYTHLTTAPLVEIDGVKEEHKIIKVKNEEEIYNVIHWVLSR